MQSAKLREIIRDYEDGQITDGYGHTVAQAVRDWLQFGTVFPDLRLVAAIVDRVTFNAHILETGTQSYRLRTTKTATRTKNPS